MWYVFGRYHYTNIDKNICNYVPFITFSLGLINEPKKTGEDFNMNLQERYELYVKQAYQLGWKIKPFDEWLNT